jgi:hypothetical protein
MCANKEGEEVTIPTDMQENSPYYITWLNFSTKQQTSGVVIPKSSTSHNLNNVILMLTV